MAKVTNWDYFQPISRWSAYQLHLVLAGNTCCCSHCCMLLARRQHVASVHTRPVWILGARISARLHSPSSSPWPSPFAGRVAPLLLAFSTLLSLGRLTTRRACSAQVRSTASIPIPNTIAIPPNSHTARRTVRCSCHSKARRSAAPDQSNQPN